MRGGTGGRAGICAGVVAAVLTLSISCGGPAADPTDLPTFPAPSAQAGPTTDARPDDGAVPDDCEQLLKVADLDALLGLPLDSVGVRTTIGVPELSVGRTERVACRYTGTRGRTLLDLNAAAYTDGDAAARQWRVNADEEDGDRRDLPIGSAPAVLVERRGEAVLTVVYGAVTVTMVLPDQPLPGNRPRPDVLVDLALRVIPAVAPPTPTPPPSPTTAPSQAVGNQ